MLLSVFTHRAVGSEARSQLRHTFPHPCNPCGRNAVRVSGIELGNHFAFKQVVECVGFDSVPAGIVAMFLAVSQGPPHFRRVGFCPPAIQLREIDAPIDQHFHAARPASLPGPAWRVDPHIHALHQVFSQKHVVITQEDHMGARLWPADELPPLLNQGLSRLVLRMRFASNNELHRTLQITEQTKQPLRIVQQQVRSLVGCEAPRKAQCQRVGIKEMLRPVNRLCRSA